MVKQIAHVCIGATDLEATERFYCGVLGFARKFRFLKGSEPIGFYLDAGGGTFIEVFRQDDVQEGSRPLIRHFCLLTDDIDRLRQALLRAGHEVTEKKKGCDQSWQAWVTDPSGVRIEFHQYTAQSSQLTGSDCVLPH